MNSFNKQCYFKNLNSLGELILVYKCFCGHVLQVYDEAVQVLPTAKMFSLYAQFWLELVVPGEAHISLQNKVDFDVSEISSYIINVYKKADDSGCLTEELACQYVSFLLQTGSIEEARNLAKELCSGKLSEAANLWILRASMEIRCLANKSASLIKDDLDSAFKLLRNSLTKLSIAKVEDLWLMVCGIVPLIFLYCNQFSKSSHFSITTYLPINDSFCNVM